MYHFELHLWLYHKQFAGARDSVIALTLLQPCASFVKRILCWSTLVVLSLHLSCFVEELLQDSKGESRVDHHLISGLVL